MPLWHAESTPRTYAKKATRSSRRSISPACKLPKKSGKLLVPEAWTTSWWKRRQIQHHFLEQNPPQLKELVKSVALRARSHSSRGCLSSNQYSCGPVLPITWMREEREHRCSIWTFEPQADFRSSTTESTHHHVVTLHHMQHNPWKTGRPAALD
jgi:hypothetical protein